MQEMINRAKELLSDGTVNRVLGWRRGDMSYNPEPSYFETAEDLDANFVYNGFCGANLSKYMIEGSKLEGKTLVFLKPCDSYSFNQLIAEHRVDRDKAYIIGVGCMGKLSFEKIKEQGVKGITNITIDDANENITVETLYGEKTLAYKDCMLERCHVCKGKEHQIFDETIGESRDTKDADRFAEVEKIEAMSPEEKFAFFQNELSRCIRCNACRNVCPACSCRKCVFDSTKFDSAQKANVDSFEERMFHIIRAFHVAGRCTDCGECSRVCPQGIPLHLFNRKFIKDIDEFYGEFQAGVDPEAKSPLTSFTFNDVEPGVTGGRRYAMFKIAKSKLPELLNAIAAQQELFLPVNNNGQVNFAAWFEGCNADIETLKTVKSPKDMFFPQSETLYTVKKEQHKLSVEPQALADQNFVAFGMKACDIQGIKVLDKVFLAEPVDTFYRARREHGTIVALACHEPEESCFCKVFGVDCAEPDADVVMWNANDTLYWKAVTDKGTALTEALSGVLENADAADEKAVETEQENIRAIVEKLPYTNLSLEGWNGNVSEEKFNSPVWEKLYKPCLACGTCTFVCPTCQCYDIKDYDTGHGIQRYRCWDSCMYSDFTMMAHGNNRTSQMQRFRQRFMHKLVYFPANNDGMYSCVGCGRCVEKCPSSLNIVKVIKAFEKEAANHE